MRTIECLITTKTKTYIVARGRVIVRGGITFTIVDFWIRKCDFFLRDVK